jgi:hypothetical protein
MATMNEQMPRDIAEIAVRLCDSAHIMWYAATIDAEHALCDWSNAAPDEGVIRYFAYRAALDREEAAARDLQKLSELTQPCQEALIRATRTPGPFPATAAGHLSPV